MAINPKLYINKIKPTLWADEKYIVFHYSFKIDGMQSKGIINLSSSPTWNKRERIINAELQLIEIKNRKKENVIDDNIVLDRYITEYFKRQKEDTTLTVYKSYYDRRIKPYIGKKKLKNILPLDIRAIIKKVQDEGKSPRTQKDVLNILRPMFKEALENRIIVFDPTANIIIKQPSTKKIVNNATEELKKISTAIKKEFSQDSFYLALFSFALQGRRKSEILNLKWKDINMDKNFYILRDTKGGEEQKMYLPAEVKKLLLDFKDDSWEYVFTSYRTKTRIVDAKRAVGKMKIALDNKSFGLHYLRNVITSAMAEQGLDSIFLSGALGHKDPNTIKKYLTMNYLKSSEMASDIIEKLTR